MKDGIFQGKPAGLKTVAWLVAASFIVGEPVLAEEFIYAGTWNNIEAPEGLGFAKGVYGWKHDPKNGGWISLGLVASSVTSADSLAARPDGKVLYVTLYNGCICTRSWPFPGALPAGVAAYAIDSKTGALRFLNQMDGLGDMPAEIRVDATGRTLALANYYGGNVVTYRLNVDGSIGEAISNFKHEGASAHASAGAHPHGLAFSANNRMLYVADQGLDRLYFYHFNATTSAIAAAEVPYIQYKAGDGPRQVSVSPDGKWVFVITEQSGEVHRYAVTRSGKLEERQVISLAAPDWALKLGAAQSRVSPDNRYLYVSHRPHEAIAIFPIDRKTGHLGAPAYVNYTERAAKGETGAVQPFASKPLWEKVETGARAFAWNSSGDLVASANLGENSIVLMQRNAGTGHLSVQPTILPVPQPSFVLFVRPQ